MKKINLIKRNLIRKKIIIRKKDKKIFLFFWHNVIIIMIGRVGGSMNNKGQALVEFVLILPILIFIVFSVIDFGMIYSGKSNLENDSTDIIYLFKDGTTIDEIREIYKDNIINVSTSENYYQFRISSSVDLITPGLNRLLGDPYVFTVERVVPYEKQ